MRILLIGSFCYPMYAKAFLSGFTELGQHTVRYIDTQIYKNKGLCANFLNKVQAKYHIGKPLLKLNKQILDEVDDFKPDFIFFYYCLDVNTITYKTIKRKEVKFFTYCNDDPYSTFLDKPWNRRFHRSLPLADWNFVYRKRNVEDYKRNGINNVSVLLPYYIKKNNYPENINRDIPISFVGHWENDERDQYLLALIEAKVPLKVFGPNEIWKSSSLYARLKEMNILFPPVYMEEYNHIINRCQVAIVFLSKLNHDTYTRRCFEIPATKTCMLCEYSDDMNRMFPEDECSLYFRNQEEFVEKATYLVAHQEECKRIGVNGYNRLSEIGGNEVDRCREVVEKYLSLL